MGTSIGFREEIHTLQAWVPTSLLNATSAQSVSRIMRCREDTLDATKTELTYATIACRREDFSTLLVPHQLHKLQLLLLKLLHKPNLICRSLVSEGTKFKAARSLGCQRTLTMNSKASSRVIKLKEATIGLTVTID